MNTGETGESCHLHSQERERDREHIVPRELRITEEKTRCLLIRVQIKAGGRGEMFRKELENLENGLKLLFKAPWLGSAQSDPLHP